MKLLGEIDEQEEKCPQSENRENIRGINDKTVGRYPEDRRDRIDGKNKVGHIDHDQHQEQQRAGKHTVFPDKKTLAVIVLSDPDKPRGQFDDGAVLGFERLVLAEHLDARVDKERAEDVQDPVELFDQFGTGEYHREPHHQRHENAPEKHAVLVFLRDLEITEYQEENEQIIDRERHLDKVAREKLLCLEPAELIVNE